MKVIFLDIDGTLTSPGCNGSPRLQELSDLVCPSVEEDGLAESFRRLGLI